MMKTKLKFFLVLLALMVGEVNDAWAQTSYEFYNDGDLHNTSNKFGWNGDAYTYNDLKLLTCMASGSYLSIPKAAQMRDENWISFTTSASATVYVGVYVNSNGNKSFLFNEVVTGGEAENEINIHENKAGAYEIIELDNISPGTYKIKKKSNDVGIYYVKVVEYNSDFTSYPYIWDFTKDWGVTAAQIIEGSGHSWLKSNDSGYVEGKPLQYNPFNDEQLTNNQGNIINIFKGLYFTSSRNENNYNLKRISLFPNNYLQIQNGVTITLKNLKKGSRIYVEFDSESENKSLSSISNTEYIDGAYVVSSDGDATITPKSSNASPTTKITKICVTKGEIPQYRINGGDLFLSSDGSSYSNANPSEISTNVVAFSYDSSRQYIRFKLNIGGNSDDNWGVSPSAFTIIDSSNPSVISVDEALITTSNAGENRVYVFGAKAKGVGTTELSILFAGNNVYDDKIVKATVTLYDNVYLAFSKTSDTYNLVDLDYTEPTLTVYPAGTPVTYSINDANSRKVANIRDMTTGDLLIVNTGEATVTATATVNGQNYTASYTLTVIANEAIWDIQNNNECYFPDRNTKPGALSGNNNTGKLLVRG